MLKVENVNKLFEGGKGIKDISFEAKEGRILGIIGKNGAGKTTLFRCIMNIWKLDSGSILLSDKNITSKELDKIGYLIEEGFLSPEKTVLAQLTEFGIIKSVPDDEINIRILQLLDMFNIRELINTKIKKISKGNRQKIQLLATLINNPNLIILDEPFSGLDPINVEQMKNTILSLKEQGKIIIFSSHRMDKLENICDDILFIHEGRNVLYGKIDDVKESVKERKVTISGNIDVDIVSKLVFPLNVVTVKNNTYEAIAESMNEASNIIKAFKEYNVKIKIENLSLEEIFVRIAKED